MWVGTNFTLPLMGTEVPVKVERCKIFEHVTRMSIFFHQNNYQSSADKKNDNHYRNKWGQCSQATL